jgi:hypothetical protein
VELGFVLMGETHFPRTSDHPEMKPMNDRRPQTSMGISLFSQNEKDENCFALHSHDLSKDDFFSKDSPSFHEIEQTRERITETNHGNGWRGRRCSKKACEEDRNRGTGSEYDKGHRSYQPR